ncbi:hypothetical protein TVAG_108220 [Trichomonas vaginalis G3]|uniref:Uncharacterized protein n=1 Tax=Trichomonas vaginalis (strain ATCC PRA-98 / G3) TaxID=412133 RepID=A2EQE6_TRIV3|nr:hypothetical protein TVAGG3_0214650 [Trichomonas vaginalis G3]EAY05088.1 hypothetical protein TVAG_108220 [Trichomonas vaginalis G3]KAI5551481.1 hypothetical protein TVAGG3_0214650 [Trichomonas vaginalis G3]|eukprot:XP_001317311.1 hypothetical protein [Trichomonas vaginalis G3]
MLIGSEERPDLAFYYNLEVRKITGYYPTVFHWARAAFASDKISNEEKQNILNALLEFEEQCQPANCYDKSQIQSIIERFPNDAERIRNCYGS